MSALIFIIVERLDDVLTEARATFELNGGKVVDSLSTLDRDACLK